MILELANYCAAILCRLYCDKAPISPSLKYLPTHITLFENLRFCVAGAARIGQASVQSLGYLAECAKGISSQLVWGTCSQRWVRHQIYKLRSFFRENFRYKNPFQYWYTQLEGLIYCFNAEILNSFFSNSKYEEI